MFSGVKSLLLFFLVTVKAFGMFPAGGSFRGSRGACFAQILMKNSGLTESYEHPSTSRGRSKDVFDQQVKSTFRRGEFQNVICLNLTDLYGEHLSPVIIINPDCIPVWFLLQGT